MAGAGHRGIIFLRLTLLLIVYTANQVECAIKARYISPREGSPDGGTQVTVTGQEFSNNQFNNDNPDLGHKVELYNSTHVIECDVIKYYSSSTGRITCETRPASEGWYNVRVYKDGTEITKLGGTYCENSWHRDHCKFYYREIRAPTIEKVTPSSGTPGSVVEVYGRTFTKQYSAGEDDTESSTKILRVMLSSYLCDPIDPETGHLYGITPHSEGSQWNAVKVKPQGTYVASQQFKYKVNHIFGWSRNAPKVLKVSGKNELYTYQTHAEIISVAPSAGSSEGGTLLTITGKYFDGLETTTVLVQGVPCKVQSVTDTEIKCVTGKKPETASVLYPGSRGLLFDKYATYFDLDDSATVKPWSLTTPPGTAPEYTKHLAEAASPESLAEDFVGRLRGMFVAPRDGDYRFLIRGDDQSKLFFSTNTDPANMEMIARGRGYTAWNWFKYEDQISKKIYLKAGEPRYFEARYREFRGGDWVQVGVMFYDAPFTSSDLLDAFNERQRIQIMSDVKLEQQNLAIRGPKEVQKVQVGYSGCTVSTPQVECDLSGLTFALTYDGQKTADLAITATADVVEAALEGLSSLSLDISVAMQTDDLTTWTFTVTFGVDTDLPEMTVAVSDSAKMTATVTEIATSTDPFVISYGGKDTKSLSPASTALEVQDALLDLFTYACQAQTSGWFVDGFEEESTGKQTGQRVTDRQPFCGRTSLMNPGLIYEADQLTDANKRTPGTFSFNEADKLCFAVNGVISKSAKFTVKYTNTDNQMREENNRLDIFQADGDYYKTDEWTFHCIDIDTTIKMWHTVYADDPSFRVAKIELFGNGKDKYFIDNLFIGKTTSYPDITSWNRQPDAEIGDIHVSDINVTKTDSTFAITMTPASCGNNFPLLSIKDLTLSTGSAAAGSDSATYMASVTEGAILYKINRITAASPPMEGEVKLTWGDKFITVPIDALDTKVKESIERLDTGTVSVTRAGSCHGYNWTVEFTSRGGLQPQIAMDHSAVTGNNKNVTVYRLQDGSVVQIIPGEFLRLPYDVPQVEVLINGIPSNCSGTCNFVQYDGDAPTVTAVSPTQGKSGIVITITGTGFSLDIADNVVTIGGIPCVAKTSSATTIECTVGEGIFGNKKVVVNVSPKGLATHTGGDVMFEYTAEITGISPPAGSTAGGTEITITGSGFCSCSNSNNDGLIVKVGNTICSIKSVTYSQIVATIGQIPGSASRRKKRSTTNVPVTISAQGGASINSPEAGGFELDTSLTPIITVMTPGSSTVIGGGNLVLTGTAFAATGNTVTLGGTACVVTAESITEITCTLPAHAPGQYDIALTVPGKGFADVTAIAKFSYSLKVTGVSPDKGSILGGTMATISGEGFGTDSSKVTVAFGDSPCAVGTIVDTKIVCETAAVAKEHGISNQGRHEVYGVGFRYNLTEINIDVGDSVRWWWEVADSVTGISFTIQQTASEDVVAYDGQGFHAGPPTSKGSYTFRFTSAGTYYYSSGPVGVGDHVMKGIINVMANSVAKQLSVKVGEYKALHDMTQSVTITPTGCTPEVSVLSSCDTTEPAPSDASFFAFKFFMCSTPVITSITPSEGGSTTQIAIQGHGFGTETCQHNVMVNEHQCTVSSVTSTSIMCNIVTLSTMAASIPQFVSVKVNNKGFAINKGTNIAEHTFTLLATITSISPSEGAIAGGTRLTVTGDGFASLGSTVSIGGAVCVIESATYTQITCLKHQAQKV